MTNKFEKEKIQNIKKLGQNQYLKKLSLKWLIDVSDYKYSYNFTWLGRPIIQFPPDIIAMQELIWKIKPDLIIETGVARGGSLIFYSSMLELIGKGKVIGIDIDIRKHNKIEIKKHPMSKRITMIQGSSVDPKVIKKVYQLTKGKKRVMVLLDSNHSHDHVLKEMNAYGPLVTKGSYMVVFDTITENLPPKYFKNKPWKKGYNSKTAVDEFLKINKRFKPDESIPNKLMITVAPGGYMECIRK